MEQWPIQFNPANDIIDLSTTPLHEILFLLNEKVTPQSVVTDKYHVTFLKDYLGPKGLNAKFAVVERGYINKDFLTDYSSYYSTCFEKYSKLCTRLHFFSTEADAANFRNKFNAIILQGKLHGDYVSFWEKEYLGFLIIKATPTHFIGFSLLRHYNFNKPDSPYKDGRIYWGVKNYKVHVFGTEVVLSTIAFQEQDKNVAACATIAIWCMLQGAAEDYYVTLKSPGEITKGSGMTSHKGNRIIPNKEGLSLQQMALAITNVNMVTEVRSIDHDSRNENFNSYLKKLIHAYSPLKIPIILALTIPSEIGTGYDPDNHAVAICGYNFRPTTVVTEKGIFDKAKAIFIKPGITWRAECINKLYCHDDQWGPFSKMEFTKKKEILCNENAYGKINMPATNYAIIISLYPKVRIAYEDIESKVLGLNIIFEDHYKGSMSWDIQLFLSEDFKQQVQESGDFEETENGTNQKFRLLTRNFPKYIWVATMWVEEYKAFQFVYDATGLAGSNLHHTVIGYHPALTKEFVEILERNRNATSTLFTKTFDYNVPRFIELINQSNFL